jgi:hypothetical protein
MFVRALVIGIFVWLGGTITIRLAGQHLLRPERALILYLLSFILMAGITPLLLRGLADRRAAVTLLMLPTLILDALACPFFAVLYPNVDPAAAGLFGGWMLTCCGGAVAGVWLKR